VRVLEAVEAEAWDIPCRTNAVDTILTLQDGRKAAFEVTNLAGEGALQLAMLLAKDKHKWPLPGDWWWTIEVGSLDTTARYVLDSHRARESPRGNDDFRQQPLPTPSWLNKPNVCSPA
jgi:hypothetical protein